MKGYIKKMEWEIKSVKNIFYTYLYLENTEIKFHTSQTFPDFALWKNSNSNPVRKQIPNYSVTAITHPPPKTFLLCHFIPSPPHVWVCG